MEESKKDPKSKSTQPKQQDSTLTKDLDSNERFEPLRLGDSDKKTELSVAKIVEWAKFYLVPIGIFIFFIAVVHFFIVPQINDLGSNIKKIDELTAEYNDKGKVLDGLSKLSQSQTNDTQLIARIEDLVPTNSTKVVEFRTRLSQIVTSSGLTEGEINTGELVLNQDKNPFLSSSELTTYLIEIPAQVTATGQIDDFKQFLINLYNGKDFFVVSQMSITKNPGKTEWSADFTITKYQFGGKVPVPNDLSVFVERKPLQEVVDFINRKYNSQ